MFSLKQLIKSHLSATMHLSVLTLHNVLDKLLSVDSYGLKKLFPFIFYSAKEKTLAGTSPSSPASLDYTKVIIIKNIF